MRKVWFSIDNQFCVDMEDDANEEEIMDACIARLGEVLASYGVADFDIHIEEE